MALLIAGWDEAEGGGAVLYQTDPSGTFAKFSAKAIGSGSEGAQTALQARRAAHTLLLHSLRCASRVPWPSGSLPPQQQLGYSGARHDMHCFLHAPRQQACSAVRPSRAVHGVAGGVPSRLDAGGGRGAGTGHAEAGHGGEGGSPKPLCNELSARLPRKR